MSTKLPHELPGPARIVVASGAAAGKPENEAFGELLYQARRAFDTAGGLADEVKSGTPTKTELALANAIVDMEIAFRHFDALISMLGKHVTLEGDQT